MPPPAKPEETAAFSGPFINYVEIVALPCDHYFDPKHPDDFTKIVRSPDAERLFRLERGLPLDDPPIEPEATKPAPEPAAATTEEEPDQNDGTSLQGCLLDRPQR